MTKDFSEIQEPENVSTEMHVTLNQCVVKMKSTQLMQVLVTNQIAKAGDVEEKIKEIGFNQGAFVPQVSFDWAMSVSVIRNAWTNNAVPTLITAIAIMTFLTVAMVQSAGVERVKMADSISITRKNALLVQPGQQQWLHGPIHQHLGPPHLELHHLILQHHQIGTQTIVGVRDVPVTLVLLSTMVNVFLNKSVSI